MQLLTLEQTSDYLEAVTIESSINIGFAIIHIGENSAGGKFALINDMLGETALAEAI